MTALRADFRNAVRALRHAPGFTIVVVLTLALGIGVNTAIFCVVQTALFQPLPYKQPDQLMRVAEWPKTGGNYTVAPAAFVHFREHARGFSGIEASIGGRIALLGQGDPQEVRASRVTAGYFDLLGITAERGRMFSASDNNNAECRAVISHQLWSATLGMTPDIIGKSVRFDLGACTVIGVLPIDAVFNRAAADVYLVYRLGAEAATQQGRTLTAIGRLAPGVSVDRAQSDLASVAATFNATRGPAGNGWTVALTPWRDVLVRADTRRLSWILIAIVGAVLLVACVNVAGLSLSRTLDRRREVAVRAALGATRLQLFRGLIVEGLVLAIAGGALALIVGAWTLRLFVSLMPAGLLPAAGASMNGLVLLFTMTLSLLTGVAFATLPSWQGATASAAEALSAGGRTISASRTTSRVRAGFVVIEVALATTLLIGAALLTVSFARLTSVSPGIDPAGVLTLRLSLPSTTYPSNEAVANGFDRILEAVRAVPGVKSASVVTSLPLDGWLYGTVFTVDGIPPAADRPTSAHIQSIAQDYFATFGIPLVAGREFGVSDSSTSSKAAIVNSTFVRKFVADGRAIGHRLQMDGSDWEIVGVSADVKTSGLADAPLATPEIYVPQPQNPVPAMSLAVRVISGDPARLAPEIRAALVRVDPALPVGRVQTMDALVSSSVGTPRFRVALIGAFALLAGILATLGVYAVRAHVVAGRRREIGIRVALGATRARVFSLVMLQGIRQVAGGLVIGVVFARALGHQIEPWLFATRVTEPAILIVTLALLLAAGLLATWAPAHRAASSDPLTTLRQE